MKTKPLRGTREMKKFTKAEVERMPNGCMWLDCRQHYYGQQPEGWRSLLTFPGVGKITAGGKAVEVNLSKLDLDVVLCPVHARELRRLLQISIFDDLDEQPPIGNA